MSVQPLLFSIKSYEYMAPKLAAAGGYELGEVERRDFPDGEHYQRLLSDVANRDVFLLGGTIGEEETLELYDLACAVVEYGARRLTLVIPYYGYATMERAVSAGEVVTAKTRARLLSAIPIAAMGNRLLAVDLHVSTIIHYFEGGIRPLHVYGKSLVIAAARRIGGDDFVLGCTDAGRAKWVVSLAHDLGVAPAFVYKRRLAGDRTEVTGVSAAVTDKPVVIYDDMIRSGGSLIGAARAYRDAGATSVAAIATHGILPGQALARLESSGLFSTIVCSDTHPRAHKLGGGFLEVVDIAPLLAETLAEKS